MSDPLPPPPLLDRAVLDDLFEAIGAEGARSVLELFVSESHTYVARIAEAAHKPDDPLCRQQARRTAHSFRSGAGQIGATAVAAAAGVVERLAGEATPAEDANPAALAEAAAILDRYTTQTIAALNELLKSS